MPLTIQEQLISALTHIETKIRKTKSEIKEIKEIKRSSNDKSLKNTKEMSVISGFEVTLFEHTGCLLIRFCFVVIGPLLL